MAEVGELYERLERYLTFRNFLSSLIIINGVLLLIPVLQAYSGDIDWRSQGFTLWLQSLGFIRLLDLPRFLLGFVLVVLGGFMYSGSRIAWLFALLALLIQALLDFSLGGVFTVQGVFSALLLLLAARLWREFPDHSATNTGLIAFFSVAALISYSVFGTLYLGHAFKPAIDDLLTAFYFSMVSMTTVGYGDIVPISDEARLFTLSVVVLGITIFTTSIVYIVGVFVQGTRAIVEKRLTRMKDHYVIIGATPVALLLEQALRARGYDVVVVCNSSERSLYAEDVVVVIGDGTDPDVLNKANVKNAHCAMALTASDAENTYILLAVRQLAGDKVKTVVVINDEHNRTKIKLLRASISFSLAQLGSEVLVKTLDGEDIGNDILKFAFAH